MYNFDWNALFNDPNTITQTSPPYMFLTHLLCFYELYLVIIDSLVPAPPM